MGWWEEHWSAVEIGIGWFISFNEQLEPVGDPRLDVLSPRFSLVGMDFVWLNNQD